MIVNVYFWLTIVLSTCALPACAVDQYLLRLMRNPGLFSFSNFSCVDSCISACQSKAGCIAVSYQQSTGRCFYSLCNNIDLVFALEWTTYTVVAKFVEGLNVPAPQLEWMLTDTCGNSSQGIRNGPKMNLYGTTYTLPFSPYSGKVVSFSGSTSSYGLTDPDTACNFAMGQESLSVMFWVYWNLATLDGPLLEFNPPNIEPSSDIRGMNYWLLTSNLLFGRGLVSSGLPSDKAWIKITNFNPLPNSWYHVAFVYDGTAGQMKTYVNYTLISVVPGALTNTYNWTTVILARSLVYTGFFFNGRLFCVKVLNISLINVQVAALGQSCIDGKVRLS